MKINGSLYKGTHTFNMTPVIDIVFQLIIFFSLVCKFIEAENFPVAVPDNCRFAAGDWEQNEQITTITVMKTAGEKADFAVGSEKIDASDYGSVVEKMARLLDIRLKNLPTAQKIVTLRVDKDICFADAQYALAAVAASSATNIKLAVLKEKNSASQ